MLLTILGLLVTLLIVGVLFVNLSPQFGAAPSEESLIKIKSSKNYKKDAFKNAEKTVQNTGMKFSKMLDFFTDGNNKTPERTLPVDELNRSYFETEPNQPRITWFGHSAVFIELEGKNIFIDPMLGEVPAPHPLLGSKRFNTTLPISIDSLPEIDVVLISHDHYDHLDYASIKQLKKSVKQFYVPLGIKAHLTSWGVDPSKIKEFDWWEATTFEGIEFVATPARHFSGRGLTNRNSTLWSSWVIKSEASSIFFSGDSGYGKHFKEIGEKYGPFDFAMLECGQYNEQWAQIHMSPEETVQAALDVKSNLSMPIHWGSFKLALHAWNDPVVRATQEAEALNVAFATPRIGEAIVLNGEAYPESEWWKSIPKTQISVAHQ